MSEEIHQNHEDSPQNEPPQAQGGGLPPWMEHPQVEGNQGAIAPPIVPPPALGGAFPPADGLVPPPPPPAEVQVKNEVNPTPPQADVSVAEGAASGEGEADEAEPVEVDAGGDSDDGGDGEKIEIRVKDINASGDAQIIGKIQNVYKNYISNKPEAEERLNVTAVDPDKLIELFKVFFPLAQYKPTSLKPIYFVTGKPGSGKSATAFYVAQTIYQELYPSVEDFKIFLYRQVSQRRSLTLQEILNHRDLKKQKRAIYIVENVFQQGIRPDEFDSFYLGAFQEQLVENKIHFIFTTAEVNLVDVMAYRISTDGILDLLNLVFNRYLDVFYPLQPESENEAQIIVSIIQPSDEVKLGDTSTSAPNTRKLLEDHREMLITGLKTLAQIGHFFELCHQNGVSTLEQLDLVYKQIIKKEDTRAWFGSLNPNERLYALLAVLFEGVEFFDLEEIYMLVANQIRAERMDMGNDVETEIIDPRRLSIWEMHKNLNITLDEANNIGFRDMEYKEEVIRQIDNYHRLLWSLVPWFVTIIRQEPATQNIHLQWALAYAIGRIGVYRPHKLQEVLDDLAGDFRGEVARSVGYALNYLCNDVDRHEYVIELLKQWIVEGHPEKLWSAGISILHIYDTIAQIARPALTVENSQEEQKRQAYFDQVIALERRKASIAAKTLQALHELLGELIDKIHESNAFKPYLDKFMVQFYEDLLNELSNNENSFIETLTKILKQEDVYNKQRLQWITQNENVIMLAVQEIWRIYPTAMVNLLNQWFATEDVNSMRPLLARRITRELFKRTKYLKKQTEDKQIEYFSPKQYFPLLKLLPEVLKSDLVASPPDLFSDALTAMLTWYEAEQDQLVATVTYMPQWESLVYPALLAMLNRTSQQARVIFREALLTQWSISHYPTIRRITHALLARSYILDGVVMDLPSSRYAILALDAGRSGINLQQSNANHILHLIEYLSVLTPLHIYHLGHSAIVDKRWSTAMDRWLNIKDIMARRNYPRLLMPILDYYPVSLIYDQWRQQDDVHDALNTTSEQEPAAPQTEVMDTSMKDDTADTQAPSIEPDNIHYILTLNWGDILDLNDFLEGVPQEKATVSPHYDDPFGVRQAVASPTNIPDPFGVYQAPAKSTTNVPDPFGVSSPSPAVIDDDPFLVGKTSPPRLSQVPQSSAESNDRVAIWEPEPLAWEWQSKLILLAAQPETFIQKYQQEHQIALDKWLHLIPTQEPTHTRLRYKNRAINDVLMDILQQVERNVITTLHYLSPDRWGEDLLKNFQELNEGNSPIVIPVDMYDAVSLITTMEEWIFDLDSVAQARHPKDVTLTISWAILLMARTDLDLAVDTVIRWLNANPLNDKKALEASEILFKKVGSALTKLLFKFFAKVATVRHHADLLRLLPPFFKQLDIAAYDEFNDIIGTLLEWAYDETWAERLIKHPTQYEAELLQALGLLGSGQDARRLLETIETFRQAIVEEMPQDTPREKEIRANLSRVLDAMRLRLQLSSSGDMPKLTEGQAYGVIFVDTTIINNPRVRQGIEARVIKFLEQWPKAYHGDNLILVLHRIGRSEPLFLQTKAGNIPRSDEILPDYIPRMAPIIVPTLERYDPSQVAFILIIASNPVWDMEDLLEWNHWDENADITLATKILVYTDNKRWDLDILIHPETSFSTPADDSDIQNIVNALLAMIPQQRS